MISFESVHNCIHVYPLIFLNNTFQRNCNSREYTSCSPAWFNTCLWRQNNREADADFQAAREKQHWYSKLSAHTETLTQIFASIFWHIFSNIQFLWYTFIYFIIHKPCSQTSSLFLPWFFHHPPLQPEDWLFNKHFGEFKKNEI